MRRNRESRARVKLIQEMHLKKEAQAWIDKAVSETTFTYTDLYRYWRGWVDRGMPYTWAAKGSVARGESNGDLYTAKIDINAAKVTPAFDPVGGSLPGGDRYFTGIGLHSDFTPPSMGGNWCSGSRAGLFEVDTTPSSARTWRTHYDV